ncbi:Crp/Fnr family transcriptional regulator [Calderihabitans maritimus]|uniref:CarD family transcriptional regulator n=1 Tax=Calderihabitans maritimus TaxID=1246530 RepID=A0A1Z5HV53_9FIRM|nr:Crp/Fnr family transcriptional regulator [Calderihabitans maritimus]GAW93227.1 CarD family transcriptional regulator [Calderihabitans maritimus]
MVGRMKLTEINILATLQQEEFKEIMQRFTKKTFAPETVMFFPDQPENLVYIVVRGKVRIYLTYEDGREFTLSILEPGDIYSTHTRSFARALEEVEILAIETGEFAKIIRYKPDLTAVMVKVLGDCLRNSIDIIEGLVFKEVTHRLVEFFISLAVERGEKTEEGILVDLGLTTEQIALMVGSTRQTVSRILNDLADKGILERKKRKKWLIKNLDLLKRI